MLDENRSSVMKIKFVDGTRDLEAFDEKQPLCFMTFIANCPHRQL